MKTHKIILGALGTFGVLIMAWATSGLISALSFAGWSPAVLLGQYFTAIGAPETLVEHYTQIKGVEYVICAAFLGTFPLFYKYLGTAKRPVRINA